MPILCVGSSVKKIVFHIFKLYACLMSALASQCAPYCSDVRNFAVSADMCYGIVILGLVLALVLAQERQDNRPQHLIHVGLVDQVFLYNHQICRPQCLTSPEGRGKR